MFGKLAVTHFEKDAHHAVTRFSVEESMEFSVDTAAWLASHSATALGEFPALTTASGFEELDGNPDLIRGSQSGELCRGRGEFGEYVWRWDAEARELVWEVDSGDSALPEIGADTFTVLWNIKEG